MNINKKNYLKILKSEFIAESGSFFSKMRCHLEWDKEAFSRLVCVMQICCEEYEGHHDNEFFTYKVERWLAQGFWYFGKSVKPWAQHPNFPREYPQEYYEKAYQRLELLASWFFMGVCPTENGWGFEPL